MATQIKAKQAGRVRMSNDTAGMAYVSRSPVKCDGCGATIEPGQLYTKARMIGGGMATFPMCRQCRSFTEYPARS